MSEYFDAFWRKHPALLYGMSLLLACYVAFEGTLTLLIPVAVLFFPLMKFDRSLLSQRLIIALILFLCGVFYCTFAYHFPHLPSEGVNGKGVYRPTEIQYGKSGAYRLKGVLKSFGSDYSVRHIPCDLLIQSSQEECPLATHSFQVEGRLFEREKFHYVLKVKSGADIKPIRWTFSFAEWRSQLKKSIQLFVHNQFYHPKVQAFLTGLITGEFHDTQLSHALGRFGLQHIMAISGFHFAVIASSLQLLFGFFFTPRRVAFCLVGMLTLYFFYLGWSPSIARAWLMALVGLGGKLFKKTPRTLNTLGVALLLMLAYDPLSSIHLGFQLSFLAAGAILLLNGWVEEILKIVWRKRETSELMKMSMFQQHGYLFMMILRKSLALLLSVNLVMAPVLLYHSHQFPLISLLVNIFFPFVVAITMWILLIGLIISCFTLFFAKGIFFLVEGLVSFLLKMVFFTPVEFDVIWRVNNLHTPILIGYLTLLFLVGILHQEKSLKKGLVKNTWEYI